MLPLTPEQILILLAVMTLGAMLQSSVGFGLALIALPILIWINPLFVPGPIMVAAFLMSVLIYWRDRKSADLTGVGGALIGRIPGTVAGAVLLAIVAQKPLAVLIGCLIIVAVLISASGFHVPPTRGNVFCAGMFSGFMGTVAAIGGPPMALLYQKEEGARMRGTLAAFFAVANIISMLALMPAGKLGLYELQASLFLLPGVTLGFWLSLYLTRFLDQGTLRPFILAVAAVGGLTVILSSFI